MQCDGIFPVVPLLRRGFPALVLLICACTVACTVDDGGLFDPTSVPPGDDDESTTALADAGEPGFDAGDLDRGREATARARDAAAFDAGPGGDAEALDDGRDPGATPGPPAPPVDDPGPRVQSIGCTAGAECVCPAGEECELDCPGGACQARCEAGSTCRISCDSRRCDAECEAGANCRFSCGTVGCDAECRAGSRCAMLCDDGPCGMECVGADSCRQECGSGCVLSCEDTTRCDQECSTPGCECLGCRG